MKAIIATISVIIYGCATPKSKLPPCDPDKVYIQPMPPVCEPQDGKRVIHFRCEEPKRYGLPYDEVDEANYNSAIRGCVEKYPPNPCLKSFTKTSKRSYQAICGREIEQGE